MTNTPLLEVCVADAESLAAAIAGGADRIELCSALELGGLTPAPGLMRLAAQAPIPVYAMVRPRSGDFVFSSDELDVMRADIDAISGAGLAGAVIGASRRDGTLDEDMLQHLRDHAQGLGLTLHRAFDLVPDFAPAIETAIGLGIERILTSGGARSVPEGIPALRSIHAMARGRISVMPGGGLTAENAGELLKAVPVMEVHSSCSLPRATPDQRAVELHLAERSHRRTSADMVAAFKGALSNPSS
ncbi:copper homeostasis protein CutC [Aestuariivirga sp. YIM B02566]|uniref:Copper homeostasis protein CutC n=1 Tax=Taklimakanibacter albus TaxID=2800327 RepID=A0ACC5R386_9HYPH|nr:copper homeostasis protein CutC [Aestuariivirga sp. YIM B02566]MBK1867125.1 copper homeostasis protein CutC [Aestuariivirga sp. YIM B02566]